LGISKELAIFAFTTTYLLAQAAGSLLISPYTESYGRKPTYIASAVIFALTTAIVGFSRGLVAVLVGRILSGLASAVPSSVLSGSIEDLWDIRARIWVFDLWVLSAIIGVSTAPCYAIALASSVGWYYYCLSFDISY
jgi:MFS family permease